MIPNPIRKVLFSIREKDVKALLMGGQACVLYGAAEFSRDADFAVLVDPENLVRLQAALDELQAERVAVPPFEPEFLERGQAVPFRCRHPEAMGMRVDLMAKMRGVESIPLLWERRTTVELEGGLEVDMLGLRDLVNAKKTQRDKDWPMIRRLVEANYFANREEPNREQILFWLEELRTPELILETVERFPSEAGQIAIVRRTIAAAVGGGDTETLDQLLREEESLERRADREYWAPLKTELEALRRAHGQGG